MTLTASRTLSTKHRIVEGTLIVDLGARLRVLSSAPRGGGLRTTRYILNHQVTSMGRTSQPWGDPSLYLRKLAGSLGVDVDCVALMTAVPMTQVVVSRAMAGGIWVECLATVGVTNAVRAGEVPAPEVRNAGSHTTGTINLIVITNACLAAPALVGAVQVATESKTGTLCDHAVPSWTGSPNATGTGTDAVVMACALKGHGPWQAYAGTHTMVGAMIGQVTADCLTQGLVRAAQWMSSASSAGSSV